LAACSPLLSLLSSAAPFVVPAKASSIVLSFRQWFSFQEEQPLAQFRCGRRRYFTERLLAEAQPARVSAARHIFTSRGLKRVARAL